MTYQVISPLTGLELNFKRYMEAYEIAKCFSFATHKGIEIKRYPVPYKAKHMVMVIQ